MIPHDVELAFVLKLRPILFVISAMLGVGAAGFLSFRQSYVQAKVGVQPDGKVLVTTNQALTPYGKLVRIEGARAKDLAISPDGSKVAVLCNGRICFYSIEGEALGEVKTGTGALGIVWTPSGDVFASGNGGNVIRLSETDGKWAAAKSYAVDIEPKGEGNPQVNGLAMLGQKTLLVALGRRNRVLQFGIPASAEASEAKLTLQGEAETDTAPYRVLMSRKVCIVANRGGAPPTDGQPQADSSGRAIAVDAKTDAALRGSITLWQPDGDEHVHVTVGRQPSGLAMSPDERTVAVACSDEDSVNLVGLGTNARQIVPLGHPMDDGFGRIPTDLAYSADGKTLFVTCGGLNAVAVVELGDRPTIRGYIPTAHFPIGVKRSGDTLVVACSKGLGNRLAGKDSRFGVHDNVGTVQFIKISEALKELQKLSAQVAENNRWNRELSARVGQPARPIPERVGEPSVFRHVIYVIKENHTYDVTFGDIKEGNGDPSLCLFPEEVTPNQHALARQFVLLDNTYTSGTNSADGHQWTSTAVANGYIEQNYGAHIRSYPYDGGDPLAFSPEGFLWTASTAKGIGTRVFGEFVDKPVVKDLATGKTPTFKQLWDAYKAGEDKYEIKAETSQAALRKVLHPRFIGFPSIVSDQWRVDQFLAEFRREKDGKMPQFSILLFPNNHTSGTNPGMPTPRAAVADNDLALGRLVEAVTKSRFWKETLILVIEDDSQLGLDHVDGHRTIAQVISPYTKRGSVNSDTFNHTSFIRTMGLVLGFPALTRFDRTATPLTSCFTSESNLQPFTAIVPKVPLDELNPPRNRLTGEALRWAIASSKLNWQDVDLADATVVARAVWHAQKPGVRFPAESFKPNIDTDD